MEIYLAGAAAAFTVDVLVYPLDTLKTRYQSQDFLKTFSPESSNKALAFRGLYHGIGIVVLATLPAAGIFFSTYESTKTVFGRASFLPEPLVHSSASAVAELGSCMVLAPAEVIKQNAQMLNDAQGSQRGNGTASTSMRALRQLSADGSGVAWRRLFTGYTALVARNLPFTALQFPIFEHIRARLWRSRGGRGGLLETGLIAGGSAASAGAAAAFITTPSDVVKTRMMLSAGNDSGSGSNSKSAGLKSRKGSWAVAREVYTDRGVRGLFRGGLFRSAWTALGSGLYLGTYDVAKVWLKQRKPDLDTSGGL